MLLTRTALEKSRPAAALGALMTRGHWAASGGASQAKRTRSDGSGRMEAPGYGAKVTGGRGRPRRSVAEVGVGSRRQRGRVWVWWIAGSTAKPPAVPSVDAGGVNRAQGRKCTYPPHLLLPTPRAWRAQWSSASSRTS